MGKLNRPEKPKQDEYVYTPLNMISLWELWEAYHEQEGMALEVKIKMIDHTARSFRTMMKKQIKNVS